MNLFFAPLSPARGDFFFHLLFVLKGIQETSSRVCLAKRSKNQDLVNVTLKAFGFTKQLQAVSLRGSVLNANPKLS